MSGACAHTLLCTATTTRPSSPSSHYSFAREVVDSVVIENVNPIARMERSLLTLAMTIHHMPDPTPLLLPAHVGHVREHSSDLFDAEEQA